MEELRRRLEEDELRRLEERYEKLRKLREYKKDRLHEVFPDLTRLIDDTLFKKLEGPKELELDIELEWDKSKLRGKPWRSLTNLLSVKESWQDFLFSIEGKDVQLPKIEYKLAIKVKPKYYKGRFWRLATVRDVLKYYNLVQSIQPLHFAEYMKVSVTAEGKKLLEESFVSKDCKDYTGKPKITYKDSITLEDIPKVVRYYKPIEKFIFDDLKDRGLTLTCAVREGESIVRKYANKRRLVVRKPEDISNMVENYLAYEFVVDTNLIDKAYPDRIIWDIDPSPYINYAILRDFVNEFRGWLAEFGFLTKLRRTGGRGVHVIANLDYTKRPDNYPSYPRQLKFGTLYSRVGGEGLVWNSAQDLIKVSSLAFGYEKKKKGRGFPLTIEKEDPSQRLWNIYVDWSTAIKDKGVRSLGSIHKTTGRICLPIELMPSRKFEILDKFSEIRRVAANPSLLYESPLPKSSFQAVEEVFKKYSWISEEYINLGPEKFCAKYVWP